LEVAVVGSWVAGLSGRGLPHSKPLRAGSCGIGERFASWSAPDLWRFFFGKRIDRYNQSRPPRAIHCLTKVCEKTESRSHEVDDNHQIKLSDTTMLGAQQWLCG
jgi:hypothetical protein